MTLASPLAVEIAESGRTIVDGMEWKGDHDANLEAVGGKMTLPVREAAAATKMTWNKREDYRSPSGLPVRLDPTRRKGQLDLRLPYIGPLFGFYIQNLRYLDSAGKPVRLEDIPEKATIRKTMKMIGGAREIEEEVKPREACQLAMDVYRRAARSTDALICVFGCDYVAKSTQDFAVHAAHKHPAELEKAAAEMAPKRPAVPARPATARPPQE